MCVSTGKFLLLQAPSRNRLRTLEICLPRTARRGVNAPIHHIDDRDRYVLGDAAARWEMTRVPRNCITSLCRSRLHPQGSIKARIGVAGTSGATSPLPLPLSHATPILVSPNIVSVQTHSPITQPRQHGRKSARGRLRDMQSHRGSDEEMAHPRRVYRCREW